MNFTFTTLGTASARPMANQFPSAHLVTVGGRLFLIDCGEGVQIQLIRSKVSIIKIDNIFISHLHGDHVFGLFGLLYTMDMIGRLSPLHIYSPKGIKEVVDAIIERFGIIKYEIVYHTIDCSEPTKILEFNKLEISAFPLNHRIEGYGFIFKGTWRDNPRSLAYCSDTAPCKELERWLQGVSLLYHEATYAQDNKLLAKKTNHSTARDAAKLASKIGAKSLVIGHFSSRYKDLNLLLDEAKEFFESTFLAKEGMIFEVE